MARGRQMVVLALLTHLSLELLGFVETHAKSRVLKSPIAVGADPFAVIGAVSSAASVFEFCRKKVEQFVSEIANIPELSSSKDEDVKSHVEKLLGLVERAELSIIPDVQQRVPDSPVEGTAFQELMKSVLNDQSPTGLSVAHAESGAGKSVAAALALMQYTPTSQTVTVLLKGMFSESLQRFLRIARVGLAERVTRGLFTALQSKKIRLQILLDNTFDGGVEAKSEVGQMLLQLARDAYETGHHVIVITQSKEAARQLADLNGERTREVQQEDGRRYRWRREEARDFLIKNLFVQENIEEILNMSEVPDTFGGWRPISTMEYLQTGRRPKAGQGERMASAWLA